MKSGTNERMLLYKMFKCYSVANDKMPHDIMPIVITAGKDDKPCGVSELSVVPVDDADPVGLAVGQVAGQVTSDSRPSMRGII
jgi:hypothetical protein